MELTLGYRVKEGRKRLGLTASALAHQAGVSEDAIRKIESGRSKQPSFATGVHIARALGVSPLILATGEDEAAPRGERDMLASAIACLRKRKAELQNVGVRHAGIFGSIARGEATPESDVDVLIDVNPDSNFSLFDAANLGIVLEEALGRRVDVVNERSVADRRFGGVFDEVVRAF